MQKISINEAINMLSTVFDEPASNLSPGVLRVDIAGWDSMGALSLMAELDERFAIELVAEESRKMSRIGDILDLLRRHGALAE